MDMNNYSYSPTMLNEEYLYCYRNDDIEITVDELRNYNTIKNIRYYKYYFSAYSWDGCLEVNATFKNKDVALSIADFIKNHFAHTQPDDNNKLQQIIDDYSKSLLNVTYSFNDYYNMNA